MVPRGPDEKPLIGDSWLFLIGINEYQEYEPLRAPVNDTRALRKVLVERYWFQPEHIVELYDRDATKRNIKKALDSLIDKLQPHDSLLVYYAGHGQLAKNKVGYWIPHDGGKDSVEQRNWISTGDLRGYMSQFKCRHVLLVADSCFSGDLLENFRGRRQEINNDFYRKAYSRKSREIITSGGLEEVPDTEIGVHSAFAYHLVGELEANTEKWLGTLKLYANFAPGIKRTTPYLGVLKDSGHQDGGSYIFFQRPSSGPAMDELFRGARRLEAEANGKKDLVEAKAKYERYLASVPQEKFPVESARAEEARTRIDEALRGIRSIEQGKFRQAKVALDRAVKKYDALPNLSSKRQVLSWQDCVAATQALLDEEYDTAQRMAADLLKNSRSEELRNYASRLRMVAESWNAVGEVTSHSDLLSALKDETGRPALVKALGVVSSSATDSRWPEKLSSKSDSKLKAFQSLARSEIRHWLKEAEGLERRGLFTGTDGAASVYSNCLDAALLLEAARLKDEAKAPRAAAEQGIKRCSQSAAILSRGLSRAQVAEAEVWLKENPDSPAGSYWGSMVGKLGTLAEANEVQRSAPDLKAWREARTRIVKIVEGLDESPRAPLFPEHLAQTGRAMLEDLSCGILVCMALDHAKVPPDQEGKAFKASIENLLRRLPRTLGLGPIRHSLLQLRKRINTVARKQEFGPQAAEAEGALRTYALMPKRMALETDEAEAEISAAQAGAERLKLAIEIRNRALGSSGKDGLDLIRTEAPKLYDQDWPKWLGRLGEDIEANEALIQDAREALAKCLAGDDAECRASLAAIRTKLVPLRPEATSWQDYEDSRVGTLWRDMHLAWRFRLYRNYEAGAGEYVFISDHDALRGPMVWIRNPPDSGSPGFFIDKYEVTVGLFAAFWRQEREPRRGFKSWQSQRELIAQHLQKQEEPGLAFPDDWPVVMVTYQDAFDFARWSGIRDRSGRGKGSVLRRLPTSAEWRRAAFGGSGSAEERLYPWGAKWKAGRCNVSGRDPAGNPLDPWEKAAPARSFQETDLSPCGAIGMGGNVSEWATARAGQSRQFILGGNYQSSPERSSSAFPHPSQSLLTRAPAVGFRCVLPLPPDWDAVSE